MSDAESAPDAPLDEPAAPPKPNRTPWIVAGIVGLVVIVAVVAWFAFLQPTEIHGAPEAAIAACREAVRGELKAPATARFDADELPHAAQQHDSWVIAGTVDSQNGFSALVRNVYVCDAAKSQKPPPDWLAFPLSLKEGNAVPEGLVESLASKSS